jgi:hypothetical protein
LHAYDLFHGHTLHDIIAQVRSLHVRIGVCVLSILIATGKKGFKAVLGRLGGRTIHVVGTLRVNVETERVVHPVLIIFLEVFGFELGAEIT